eukprot:TRINITY_DN5314_c0_g1_i7.p1 TRINITY_DN5314_c0_g1~~TRINITY_DN5314_c0_g1_i7.p1  ORF type:complete len:200 (-),score=29.46 TRINITY_DN5314_c0_g1_i7:1509-2108(-)
MRDLHSDEPEPTPSEQLLQSTRIDNILAANVLKSFKKGAIGSPTGLQLQHVIDVLDVPLHTSIISFLANLFNLMAGRMTCGVVRPYLVGTKCFTLIKERDIIGDMSAIHPITNENFERKWVLKCLTRLNEGTLSRKLAPECIGIGVSCVTELVIHTIKKHWGAVPTDQNTSLLQVDVKNPSSGQAQHQDHWTTTKSVVP